jgi:hypothetical protein
MTKPRPPVSRSRSYRRALPVAVVDFVNPIPARRLVRGGTKPAGVRRQQQVLQAVNPLRNVGMRYAGRQSNDDAVEIVLNDQVTDRS